LRGEPRQALIAKKHEEEKMTLKAVQF